MNDNSAMIIRCRNCEAANRCTDCGAKNRVPAGKLNAGAKCGKCGSKLKTEELFTPQPIMITDGNFENMVLKSPLPVLMWAWAPW